MAIAKSNVFKSKKDIEKLHNLIKHQLDEVVEKDMMDIGKMHNLNQKEVCNLFVSSGKEFASEMHLSKIQPHVFKVMHRGM